jgi:hypothetical protein
VRVVNGWREAGMLRCPKAEERGRVP